MPSTSSCWKTRRREAPRAARTAISLRRPRARVKRRLPTLAQAISSTRPTAASSIRSVGRTSPTIRSWSETTVPPQPAFSCGYSCSSRLEITSSSLLAAARSAPGASRATDCRLWFSRTARSASLSPRGTQISLATGNHEARPKSAGMTPTIVYGSPFSCRDRPRTSAAAPICVFQNRWLTITTRDPEASSSARNRRPCAGCARRISKKPAPSVAPRITRGLPLPVSVKPRPPYRAMPSNAVAPRCQS